MAKASFLQRSSSDVPLGKTFGYFMKADLTRLFEGSILMPAVVGVLPEGGWNKKGDKRIIYLDNGHILYSELKSVVPGKILSQHLHGFNSGIAKIVSAMDVTVLLEQDRNGATAITVEVELTHRNNFFSRLCMHAVLPAFKGYFAKAINAAVLR